MNDNKLLKLLKSFSLSEFNEFEKFVNSPFFSSGRDLSDFFKCLKPYYPEFDHKNFSEEKIFLKLFPGKKFIPKTSVNVIHKFSSELHKLGKEYLIQIELRNDGSRKFFYLLNKLREKELYSEFEREYKNSESASDNIYKGGVNDFLNGYFIMQSYFEYCLVIGDVGKTFDSILSLTELSAAVFLIDGYRNKDSNKCAQSFNIQTRYNLTDNLISHLNSEDMLAKMKQNNDKYYPYVAVSHAIHMLASDPYQMKYYFNLKHLVYKYKDLYGNSELYFLFSTLINFCIRNAYGKDHDLLVKEEFQLYKKVFELGVYKHIESDKIPSNHFRNILICALDNFDIEWSENFVNQYLKDIQTEFQENMKFYSMAHIYFAKGEFKIALENIIKVKYDMFIFKMDVKILMFKIYFEMDLIDQAYSILDTFKHYIANSKDLSEKMKILGINFAKYAAKLLNTKNPDQDTDPELLKENISVEEYLSAKTWFLKKISNI